MDEWSVADDVMRALDFKIGSTVFCQRQKRQRKKRKKIHNLLNWGRKKTQKDKLSYSGRFWRVFLGVFAAFPSGFRFFSGGFWSFGGGFGFLTFFGGFCGFFGSFL